MCIRTIKSIGLKEYASGLWNSVKEIDGGKILSSASSLLEVNVKAIKNKIDALCDENTEFAIRDKLYLVKDFCQCRSTLSRAWAIESTLPF